MTTERDDDEREDLEPQEDEERTTVSLEDTDDDEPEAKEEEPKKPTRADKKAERLRLREKADEADGLRRERDELRDRVSRLEGAVSSSMQQNRADARQARAEGDDPLEAALNEINDELESISDHAAALGGKGSNEQYKAMQQKIRALDLKKMRLVRDAAAGAGRQPEDPTTATRRGLEIAYADVYGNPRAREWAKAEYGRLVNNPDPRLAAEPGLETVKRALDAAKAAFFKPTPTSTDRSRLAGVSRGGTGSGGRITEITMTKEQERMADARYRHISDPKKRRELWAKSSGKSLAEERQTARSRR